MAVETEAMFSHRRDNESAWLDSTVLPVFGTALQSLAELERHAQG